MIDANFDQLDPFLARFLDALSPRERRNLLTNLGQSLRRSNSRRIAANVEPDGSPMAPRKRRRGQARGKMFPRLRLARNLKVRPTPDEVELSFGYGAKAAEEHHFGLVGNVGKTRDGRTIRARYTARLLLGLGDRDESEMLSAITRHLSAAA